MDSKKPKVDISRRRTQFKTDGPSRTKQAFKEDCDINNIMRKHAVQGMLSHVNANQGSYGDFTGSMDFQSAQNLVIEAHDRFSSLPAIVRKRFNNDPGAFMEFTSDPKNRDEAKLLGLLDEKTPSVTDQLTQLNESIKNLPTQLPSSAPKTSKTSSKNS